MRVPALAFVRRSLAEHTRQGRTFLVLGGLTFALFMALLSAHVSAALFGAPGLRLFAGIVYINFWLICLAGPAYFASLITEEKESMTLGLLKMTGLGTPALLLGKSGSHLLGAVLLLLAQLPFTGLAVTLGGVSRIQIVAAYLTLLAFLMLMSSLGLLCSVVARNTGRAGFLTGIVIIAMLIASSLGAAGAFPGGSVAATVPGWFARTCALNQIGEIMATGFSGPVLSVQVASNLAAGIALFLLAWAAFERFTRDELQYAPARGLSLPRRGALRALAPGRVWKNALAWKDFYFIAGGKVHMLVKFLAFGALLGGLYLLIRRGDPTFGREGFVGMTVGIMLFVVAVELVLLASHLFGSERKWQTLSALMVLPYTARQITYRKAWGCLISLLPAVFWLAFGVAVAPSVVIGAIAEMLVQSWYTAFIVVGALAQVVFVVHLAAYLGLVMKRGALLLTIAIWLGGNMCPGVLMMLTMIPVIGPFVLLGLTVWLHWALLRRLQRVAGSE